MKFIDKELSIKLKEKGFDRACYGFYDVNDEQNKLRLHFITNGNLANCLKYGEDSYINAPTIQQVLKWLREEKDIHIKSDISFRYTSEHKKDKNGTYSGYMNVSKPFWSFLIRKIKNGNCVYDNTTASNNEYSCYEDACIAGIEYVINNLI
jgi:hypothetical protein